MDKIDKIIIVFFWHIGQPFVVWPVSYREIRLPGDSAFRVSKHTNINKRTHDYSSEFLNPVREVNQLYTGKVVDCQL